MFRRLTELITPPIRRAHPEPKPLPEPEPDLGTKLKPLLKQLVSLPRLEGPVAQECLNALKQLATQRGLYLTAFEIRTKLDLMPRVDEEGAPVHRQRGYVLAGDFFYSHLRKEIEAAKAQTGAVGPNVFRSYCDELVECLLRSGNVRRAIEVPMTLLDELVAGVLDSPGKAEYLLELAAQVAVSTRTSCEQRLQRQNDPASRSGISSADLSSPFVSLDEACIDYIEDVSRQLGDLKARLVSYREQRAANPAPLSPDEWTQALLDRAAPLRYLAIPGAFKARAGFALLAGQPEKAAALLSEAAGLYEEQGDVEIDLFFTKLSGSRYARAGELYTKAGDAEGASRAQAKAGDAAQRGKR
jgi:tetratricopeptide (TPR) repeat protein